MRGDLAGPNSSREVGQGVKGDAFRPPLAVGLLPWVLPAVHHAWVLPCQDLSGFSVYWQHQMG